MKVDVELPVFLEDEKRVINIMSGIEHRARKYPDKPWEIKTQQCNACGKCCMQVAEDWPWGRKEDGSCAHLVYSEGHDNGDTCLGWLCDYGGARPLSCSVGDEAGQEHCSVVWTEVE